MQIAIWFNQTSRKLAKHLVIILNLSGIEMSYSQKQGHTEKRKSIKILQPEVFNSVDTHGSRAYSIFENIKCSLVLKPGKDLGMSKNEPPYILFYCLIYHMYTNKSSFIFSILVSAEKPLSTIKFVNIG